jgi:hypothetical protein
MDYSAKWRVSLLASSEQTASGEEELPPEQQQNPGSKGEHV